MFSFLFVEEWKLFIKKSSVLKCNQGSVKFLLNFQVHLALYGQENHVFEREFMYL